MPARCCPSCGCDVEFDAEESMCVCGCHTGLEQLEPIKRTYDADELGIDQEDD